MVATDNRKPMIATDNRKPMVATDSRNPMVATDSRNPEICSKIINGWGPLPQSIYLRFYVTHACFRFGV